MSLSPDSLAISIAVEYLSSPATTFTFTSLFNNAFLVFSSVDSFVLSTVNSIGLPAASMYLTIKLYLPVFSSFSDISPTCLASSFTISTPLADNLYPSYISVASTTANSPFLTATSFITFSGILTGSASPSAFIFTALKSLNSIVLPSLSVGFASKLTFLSPTFKVKVLVVLPVSALSTKVISNTSFSESKDTDTSAFAYTPVVLVVIRPFIFCASTDKSAKLSYFSTAFEVTFPLTTACPLSVILTSICALFGISSIFFLSSAVSFTTVPSASIL